MSRLSPLRSADFDTDFRDQLYDVCDHCAAIFPIVLGHHCHTVTAGEKWCGATQYVCAASRTRIVVDRLYRPSTVVGVNIEYRDETMAIHASGVRWTAYVLHPVVYQACMRLVLISVCPEPIYTARSAVEVVTGLLDPSHPMGAVQSWDVVTHHTLRFEQPAEAR